MPKIDSSACPWGYLLTSVFLLAGLTVPASAQGAKTFADHKQECLRRIERSGITKAVADEVCTCTINKFERAYSIQEFNTLVNRSRNDKAVARKLAAVGESCLYEE